MKLDVRVPRNSLFLVLELVLMMIGVASLTWFGLMKLDEARGQAALKADFERRLEKVEPAAAPAALPAFEPAPDPVARAVASGKPQAAAGALGRLRSERIGLDVMVAAGVDRATLDRAAGWIPGTAQLDEAGNVGLAAHRDTFFRPLRDIRKGDELELETLKGRYRYRVESLSVVEPDNVTPLEPTSEPALTLVTCFPFSYIGPAPRRFIVRATRMDDGSSLAAASN